MHKSSCKSLNLKNSKSLYTAHIFTNPIQTMGKLDEESESGVKIWEKVSLWVHLGLLCFLTIFDNHT
jgi:hypothetical protein